MKATVKAKYDVDKSTASFVSTLAASAAGDARISVTATDASFVKGPSLQGLKLTLEKPGAFIIDCDVPKKDFRFQFMNTVRVQGKPLSLTYIHFFGAGRTTLDSSLTIDPANKVTASYDFISGGCKLKYAYTHGDLRRTVFEPVYDVGKNTWDFAVSRRVLDDDVIKASYQTASSNLGLEWSRDSKVNGSFKISASVNLAEQAKVPKLIAESTWNYEI